MASDRIIAGVGEPASGLPARGSTVEQVKAEIERARVASENSILRSDVVYPPGDEVLEVVRAAGLAFLQANVLYRDLFPEVARFERELVQMAVDLFHGDEHARGSLTGGGTESILLAVKSARDLAAATRPRAGTPTIVVPQTGHPAFTRAAQLFGLRIVHTPLGPDHRVDLDAYLAAVSDDVVLMVGSAPSYPTGVVDPIAKMAEHAAERDIPFHVDGCLGGLFLPFAERAGRGVFPDFRLPGVTTISADFHKFGYASTKGVSVIVHRDQRTFERQIFESRMSDGNVRYVTEGLRGSRSAAPVAAMWAVAQLLGEDGFQQRTVETLELIDAVVSAIKSVPGLHVVFEPQIPHVSYASDTMDIFAVSRGMSDRGWAMHQDDFPTPLIRGLWPWGMRAYLDDYLQDLREVVDLVASGALAERAEAAY
jgi:glutamate/tyrosine decarboxylase-like PLP-dependent enzyme